MVNFVGIGGGTGLSVLLRGLKRFSARPIPDGAANGCNISAVVCVSDNGGSSGYLRQSFNIPAVGDLRNCLVALSGGDRVMSDLFQHRFSGGNGLEGHSLGNLIVTAFLQMSGSLGKATDLAEQVLDSRGRVLPVTEREVTLCAELDSGRVLRGEWQITAAQARIRRVWLEPDNAVPARGVLQAISCADAIILGPGSLYTSIIPNLLVEGVGEAVCNSQALKIFPCNLMTQPGETDGVSAAEHLRILENYLGPGGVDLCLLNSRPVERHTEERYQESGSEPVAWDESEIARMGVVPIAADLLAEEQGRLRHDPSKLASLIMSLTRGVQRARDILCGRESLVA